jgi:DNA-binding FadR family transcriptional regulator
MRARETGADMESGREAGMLGTAFAMARRQTVRTKARTLASAIRAYVEEGIATGAMQPGSRLPTERELMASFRAGRNTVRKAMSALEAEGKIVRQVGSGTFVSEAPAAAGDTEALIDQVAQSVARLVSPSDVMELRLVFEPALMPMAALRASLEEIERMERIVAMSGQAGSLEAFEKLDCELHTAFGRATKNMMFARVYDMITAARERAEWGRLKERVLTLELRRNHTEEHKEIVAAIRARDGEHARAAMERHLLAINRSMFGATL